MLNLAGLALLFLGVGLLFTPKNRLALPLLGLPFFFWPTALWWCRRGTWGWCSTSEISRRKQAEIAAERRVIEAKGERDAAILRAEGEARAIELRGRALKNAPEVVQLTFAEKLAPGVQTVFVPATGNFLLDLRGQGERPAR